MVRVGVIDVGTVTARLAIADVEDGRVVRMAKQSQIVNLGEGVDRSGVLAQTACARLLACIDGYLAQLAQAGVTALCCTLTSAARDARNADELLSQLEHRGLSAQVIPGKVEGSLTFLGVAQDFVGERLLVADNGGGSTEFALGQLGEDRTLRIERVQSIDVGCRRMTEKFLQRSDPPTEADLANAHAFARSAFAEVGTWFEGDNAASRLVVTGGTATTIVALKKGLVPYDPAQVHLAVLSEADVEEQERRLARLTEGQRGELPGIQVKRAPVILGGVIAVDEVMRATRFGHLSVSESDLLFGLSLTVAATVLGESSPVGWKPRL